MRQLLYVSDSLIGNDMAALDRLMIQAQNNNALDGLTGLLWTDGKRFAQVIEGEAEAISELLEKIRADPRHRDLAIVHDGEVSERQFGEWSMTRPVAGTLADIYAQRMRRQLSGQATALSARFAGVIAGPQA